MTHAHTHQWVDGKHSGVPRPGSRQTETIRENTKARGTEPSRGCRCAQTLGRDTKEQSRAHWHCPTDGDRPGPTCGPPPTPQATHPDSAALPQSGPQTWPRGDSRAAEREPRAAARRRRSAFATGPQRFRGSSEGARQPAPQSPLAPGPVAPAAVAHAPHRHRAASPEARPPRLRRPSPESDVPAPQRAQRRRRRRRRSGVRGSAAAILAPAGSDVGGAPAAPTPTRSGARGSRLLGAPTRRDPDELCWPHCQSLVHRGPQSVTLGEKPASPLLGQADHGRVMAEGFIAPQRIHHPSHGQGCWAWWRTL